MANDQSTFVLKLETKGMPEAQRSSKEIRENLEGAQKAASATKVARSAAAQPTGMAGVSAGIGGREVEDYNMARGAAGAAGGSARDFADQARGLGGLVRLYATFAANIFAVSAAFTALSRAMDTTNMVKGLDQLGAASGRNLGTLSKQLAQASDGAVSLREAMEATVKASSAGLSSKQILEMGEGAKKAAQALGLDMTDALSRLSRGISKIEPELLDELGIYVKLEDATEKYARSIGKTAASLTDYERRQSFALAALDQLNKKFGEIQIDTNPYNKLLASLQNLLQTGLEVVNRVLGPIVKFLSESPVALTAVLLLIGKTLLTQAIPYFGQFRKSIEDQAVSAKKALETAEASRAAYRSYKEELIGTAVAQQELSDRMKATAAVQSLSTANRASTRRLASPDLIAQASAEGDVANLEVIKQKSLEIDKQIKLITRSKAATEAAKQKNQEDLDILRAAKRELDAKVKSAKEYKDVVESTVKPKQTGMFDTSKAAKDVREIESARRTVKGIDILKDVGEVYDAEGFKAGFGQLKEQLLSSRKELGLFGTAMTAAKGIGMLLASGIGQVLSMLNGFTMAIGIAVGAFELLDSWFSTNTKQAEEFAQALETTDSSLKLVKDTAERISKQGLGSEFLPQSIEARANAFAELSAGVERTSQAFRNLNKASSWWDNLIDSLKPGGGRTAQLADSLSKQINAAFDIMKLDSARESVQKEIKNILQIKNLDNASIKQAFKDAGSSAEELGDKISKILTKASQQSVADANRLKEALQGFDNLNKAYQDLSISLKDTSPIATFADNLIKGALQSQEALTNNTNTISLFNEIVKDNSKLKFFSPESIKSLKDTDGAIKATIGTIESLEKDIRDAEAAQNTLNSTMSKMSKQQLAQVESYQKAGIETFVDKLQATVSKGEKAKLELGVNVNKLRDQLQTVLNEPFLKGAQLVAAEFTRSAQKAQLDVTASLASRISGPGRAEADYEIQKERIQIEKSSISAMYNLIQSIEKNSLTLKQVDLEKAIREEKVSSRVLYEGDRSQLDALEKSLLETEAALGAVDKGLRLTIGDFNKLSAIFPGIAKTLSGFFAATMGTKSKLAGQEGQLAVAGVTREFGKEQEKFQDEQKRSKEELARLNIEKERAALIASIYGLESQSLTLLKQQTAEKAAQKDDEINRAAILKNISEQEKIRDELLKVQQSRGQVLTDAQQATLNGAKQSAEAARKELKAFDEQVALRKQLREVNNEIENQRAKSSTIEKEADLQQILLKNGEDLAKISLDSKKQELDALISLGLVSEEYAAKRLAEFAQQNQAIIYQSQLREAAAVRDVALRAALNKAAQAEIAGGDQETITAQRVEEETRALQIFDARVLAIDKANTSQSRSIELTKQLSLETAKQNEELKKQAALLQALSSVTDSLGTIFGEAGKKFGTAIESLGKTLTDNFNKRKDLEKDYQKELLDIQTKNAGNEKKSLEEEYKLDKKYSSKRLQLEVSEAASITGIAKGLMNEKSKGYKLLAQVEKALHIIKLGMMVKEAAVEAAKNTQSITGTVARAGIDAVAAVIKAISSVPFPFNLVAGAVTAAAVAGLLAQIGGSAPTAVAGAGASSADRQETQATGMSWVDGKKVENGGGVFGDPEAKTDPIRKSLERISQTSVDGVFENRKMVKLLESIDNSIGNAAKGLFSVSGLRTGSAFGTVEGTNSGKGLLGTGLFASKTSRNITDSGILIEGTFRQLAGQVSGGIVQLYEDVVTTTKKWYGRTKSRLNREVKDLPDALEYINEVFSYSGDLFVELGDKLGVGKDQVWSSLDALGKLKFEGSLRGLKGDELNAEVQSIIGNQLDKATVAVFGTIVDKFKDFGESALETVIRVVDETEKGLQALGNISVSNGKRFRDQLRDQLKLETVTETRIRGSSDRGFLGFADEENVTATIIGSFGSRLLANFFSSFDGMDETVALYGSRFFDTVTETITRPLTEAEVAIREAEIIQDLKESFGGGEEGFETFLTSVENFRTNFLTEAERLQPLEEMVSTTLGDLGLGFIDTRQEFKDTIQSLLDVTNPMGIVSEEGRDLLSTLLKLEPAVNQVFKETEKALTVEEMRSKVLSQQISILKLLGKDEEALALQRAEELAELAKYPKAQSDILIANQKYIYALEDEKSLKDKLIKQRDKEKNALNSTINSLKNSITTLDNYRTALLGGDKSILTPIEKYQQSQLEFIRLQALAQGPAVTDAEKASQADAISKLPAAADKFLESSRTLFASSDRYTADFNSVMSTVDKTSTSLAAQKSTAELQLDQLESSTSFLDAIQDNTYTTAQLLEQYFVQQQTTQTLAQGATLTEPQQPQEVKEVTDKAVVAEIIKTNGELAKLRLELERLRTEQQAQTGAIIASNAQVTNNSAQTVVGAVQDNQDYMYWYSRQVVDAP